MLNSIIQNISKPFNRSQSYQQSADFQSGPPRQDRIEDGFLLVGDTASERTTIYAHSFQTDGVDAPPNYREIISKNSDLPSYQAYTASMFAQSPTLDASQIPGLKYGSPLHSGSTTISSRNLCTEMQKENPYQGSTFRNCNRNAISDVPFVLGQGLQVSSVVSDSQRRNIFQQKSFDFSQYDYDFQLEKSLLKEQDFRDCERVDFFL